MKNTIESGIFFWRREGLFHDPFWVGGYILRSKPRRLRPSSFFIAVALENKFSTLHQRKMPHKGAFDFLAEREGFEPPDL